MNPRRVLALRLVSLIVFVSFILLVLGAALLAWIGVGDAAIAGQ